jgi:hypothetical protein
MWFHDHILILTDSSSVVEVGIRSLKSKRSQSRLRRLGEYGLDQLLHVACFGLGLVGR